MKKLLFVLSLTLAFTTLYSQQSKKVEGYWLTEKGTSQIQIYQSQNGKYFGKIVWLEEPNENGAPKKDKENPDNNLKKRSLLNLPLLEDFEFDKKDKEWENGTIYDPESGKTYDCYMWFDGNNYNQLNIKGFVMGMRFMGRQTIWKREISKR